MTNLTLPITGNIIDSHANVVRQYFPEDRDAVIARAFANNVVQMLNPAVDLDSVPELIELAENYADIFIAVGLHPHEAKSWSDQSAPKLEEFCTHPKVKAIGECGLDFYYNLSDRQAQLSAFRAQVKLAASLNLPLIIHSRDAWDDIFEILNEVGAGKLRGVFHCFTGGPEVVERIAALDFYVSFSGILTFPNAKNIQAAAPLINSSRLMVETDCPYLAPQKMRGKRNEPSYVWYVVEKLAQLRNENPESLSKHLCDNARELFDIPEPVT